MMPSKLWLSLWKHVKCTHIHVYIYIHIMYVYGCFLYTSRSTTIMIGINKKTLHCTSPVSLLSIHDYHQTNLSAKILNTFKYPSINMTLYGKKHLFSSKSRSHLSVKLRNNCINCKLWTKDYTVAHHVKQYNTRNTLLRRLQQPIDPMD